MTPSYVGLCPGCRHHHWIVSGRGSRFLRCEKSFTDPAYPRYPQLPVFGCPGFAARWAEDSAEEARAGAGADTAEAAPGAADDAAKGEPDDR